MKVWFDLSNSPHINLFAAMIRDLQQHGHEIVITCRPLANTIDLLKLHGLHHDVVGAHYGGRLAMKIFGFPIRVLQLWRHLRRKGIDVAVSQSSFHSPLVARLLGVPAIYMNDNEHAMGNIPSFVFASRILVPEFLAVESLRKQWAAPAKVKNYPGVKEGIYLWDLAASLEQRAGGRDRERRPKVYVRPEPWTAQYYKGERNFLDELILGIREHVDVVVLPRGKVQGQHYRDGRFAGIEVVDTALDLADIAPDCDLFIGAGGTMTREMAVLGIPTVSVYRDELLDVDRHLLEVGAFTHEPELSSQRLLEILESARRRPPNRVLLEKGKQAYELIKKEIVSVV